MSIGRYANSKTNLVNVIGPCVFCLVSSICFKTRKGLVLWSNYYLYFKTWQNLIPDLAKKNRLKCKLLFTEFWNHCFHIVRFIFRPIFRKRVAKLRFLPCSPTRKFSSKFCKKAATDTFTSWIEIVFRYFSFQTWQEFCCLPICGAFTR